VSKADWLIIYIRSNLIGQRVKSSSFMCQGHVFRKLLRHEFTIIHEYSLIHWLQI